MGFPKTAVTAVAPPSGATRITAAALACGARRAAAASATADSCALGAHFLGGESHWATSPRPRSRRRAFAAIDQRKRIGQTAARVQCGGGL